ncbi:MAG: threonine dehydrogenase, partial [Verrucomicrobia bacterium]|nr:threonine dehydrogenase [Verrucomicrobiota bacterium]
VNAVVVAASVKALVGVGLNLLRRAGHLSIFAGMPKSDPVLPLDTNRIHYYELNLHGANSSSQEEYLQARDFLVAGKIDARPLVTHRFRLDQFNEAVKTQGDPSCGSLKIVIIP